MRPFGVGVTPEARAFLTTALIAALLTARAPGADWPMWRHDASRSGNGPQALPESLQLQWTRALGTPAPAFNQVRQGRLQFDRGHEPIVIGKTLLVGSSSNDSLLALDTETGEKRWQFFADGPIRLAPAAADGRAFVGSDDGCLYCLDVASGELIWKYRVVPSSRKVLGNGRMISLWPVRGGPVVQGGIVYAAAGVWPFEGIFVIALDARDGSVRWCNDRTGSLYITHPHNASAFGGPSPQGYLLLHQGKLVAPSGRAFPAFYDTATGALDDFDFGHAGFGSRPGSWFVMTGSDGRLHVDPNVNTGMHDSGDQIIGQTGVRRMIGETIRNEITIGKMTYAIRAGISRSISAGGREYRFDEPPAGVEGEVHSMIAADDRLFVVTREGRLHAFGTKQGGPTHHQSRPAPLPAAEDRRDGEIGEILTLAGTGPGYAMVFGVDERLITGLVRHSKFDVVAIEPDAAKIGSFRRRMDDLGLYGSRVSVLSGSPFELELPPYFARLLTGDVPHADGDALAGVIRALRPYGGAARFRLPRDVHDRWASALASKKSAGIRIERQGDFTWIRRDGPLPGARDYSGEPNFDEMVRAPLGVLWFGDTHYHHKLYYRGYAAEIGRGLPQTITVNHGVTHYLVPKEPIGSNPKGLSYADYMALIRDQMPHEDAFTDAYTGLTLAEEDAASMGFVPPVKKPMGDGACFAIPSMRRNPVTGIEECRQFQKTYGCDGFAVDYGNLYTMRSGTAAFYDPRIESGTINISGMRSGCRNNVVPADGVLNIPHWTGNCTCNYPMGTSLALQPMPEEHEQWSAWGLVAASAPIRRVGLNFGAPGDRMTREGTLWLDWPSVGGPSPDVKVEISPQTAEFFYRHAAWMKPGQGWPWVAASGVKGMRSIAIEPAVRRTPFDGSFGVRWTGWLQAPTSGAYIFHLRAGDPARLKIETATLIDTGKGGRRDEQGAHVAGWKGEAGKRYAFQIEYARPTGATNDALCELQWTPPGGARGPIAAASLFSAAGESGHLTGCYHDSAAFNRAAFLRKDSAISFQWGGRLPEPLQKADGDVTLEERRFTVRLHFGEPERLTAGQRVFDVDLQGRHALENFDIVREAGGPDRGIVREFRDVAIGNQLRVDFRPKSDMPPIIAGIELISE